MKTATREAIQRELKAASDLAETAENESRDLTGEERAKVKAHIEAARNLKTSDEESGALRKQLADLTGGMEPERKEKPAEYGKRERGESVGGSFVGSPEFKAMMSGFPAGQVSEKMRVHSQPFGLKALVDITGSGDRINGPAAYVNPDRYGALPDTYARPLTLRDLVTNGTTQSDTIEYVVTGPFTNNAAPVPEATSSAAIGGGATTVTGGVKPESAIGMHRESTTVKTIAHWLPATKRALSDAGQIRTLIDAFLLYGLEEELEDQMLSGNGTGENLRGLANVSGTTAITAGAGEDVFDVTRRARTQVRIAGRATPSAYLMNPLDWEAIELARDGNGQFYAGGPFALRTPGLWALPVVESEAIPQGTAWVADWSMAVLWDREQASIQVTDSHADFFVRNLVAILAEMRAAFGVLRPSAFAKITLP